MRTPTVVLSALVLALGMLFGVGAPAQAAGVPGAAVNVTAHATAADQITVTWAPPANDGGAGPLTYAVVASPSDGTPAPAQQSVSATSAVFTGLNAGTIYMFTVSASNANGTGPLAYSMRSVAASETPIPLGTVSISGTPQFLQTLSAPPAGWSANATYQYQWSVNGTPIPNAASVHFTVTDPSWVGQSVTASVVVSRPGFIDSPPQQVSSGLIAPAPMPGIAYIGGTPTAGHTWLAGTSGWPESTTFSYQWTLDGMKTATTVAYAVAGNLFPARHMVGVTVTGQAPGYTTQSITVPALRVQPYNPLAGGLWPYDPSGGSWDHDLVHDYLSSTGTSHLLQGKIATRPRATWFGGWLSPQQAASMVQGYISAVQNGNPSSLVQLTLHTIWTLPGAGGEDGRVNPLTPAQITTYKQWMKAVAAAIGTTRVAIIMEPDLALLPKSMSGEVNTADPMVRVKLVAWATKLLASNPNAAVYLDSGDSDWQHVATMVPWLKLAGIQYARGFALGATHYSKATDDIAYGTAMVSALARVGISPAHAHYVVDTADNGRGFTWQQWARVHGGASFNNASPCQSKSDPGPCASLGVPPTWQVIDTKLPLTAAQQYAAVRQLDGFLWFSRPWLPWQTYGYSPTLGQNLAASSPYA